MRRYDSEEFRALWRYLSVEELYCTPFNCFLFPLFASYLLLALCENESNESNLKKVHPVVISLLEIIFSAERFWLKMGVLPFGSSFCAVLIKRECTSVP